MGVVIPNWEGERRADTGDTVALPTKDEHDALVDRINAVAAQVGGAVGALPALTHSDPTSHGG